MSARKAQNTSAPAGKASKARRAQVKEDWDDEEVAPVKRARKTATTTKRTTTKATKAKAEKPATTTKRRSTKEDRAELAMEKRTVKTTAKRTTTKATKAKAEKAERKAPQTKAQANGWKPLQNMRTSREIGGKILDVIDSDVDDALILRRANKLLKQLREVSHGWTVQKYERLIEGFETLEGRKRERFLDMFYNVDSKPEWGYEAASNKFLGTNLALRGAAKAAASK